MAQEHWETDEDLAAAKLTFTDRIPGYEPPAVYSVARIDAGALTFGHVNDVGGFHQLPAAVLASVCGYVAETATFSLTREQLAEAVRLLSPAEAAKHYDHPNLLSWRELLKSTSPESTFVAIFVRNTEDPPVGRHDAQFRTLLKGDA